MTPARAAVAWPATGGHGRARSSLGTAVTRRAPAASRRATSALDRPEGRRMVIDAVDALRAPVGAPAALWIRPSCSDQLVRVEFRRVVSRVGAGVRSVATARGEGGLVNGESGGAKMDLKQINWGGEGKKKGREERRVAAAARDHLRPRSRWRNPGSPRAPEPRAWWIRLGQLVSTAGPPLLASRVRPARRGTACVRSHQPPLPLPAAVKVPRLPCSRLLVLYSAGAAEQEGMQVQCCYIK